MVTHWLLGYSDISSIMYEISVRHNDIAVMEVSPSVARYLVQSNSLFGSLKETKSGYTLAYNPRTGAPIARFKNCDGYRIVYDGIPIKVSNCLGDEVRVLDHTGLKTIYIIDKIPEIEELNIDELEQIWSGDL